VKSPEMKKLPVILDLCLEYDRQLYPFRKQDQVFIIERCTPCFTGGATRFFLINDDYKEESYCIGELNISNGLPLKNLAKGVKWQCSPSHDIVQMTATCCWVSFSMQSIRHT